VDYGLNQDFGESGHVNAAAKAYFLLWDTDIDLMFLTKGSRPGRYGFDFSTNICYQFENPWRIGLDR
jgi:hypothetical protein